MNHTATVVEAHASTLMGEQLDQRPQAAPVRLSRRSDAVTYLLIFALVLGAWLVSRMGLYSARSEVSYWIGVVGGSMMLLLFAYPMRKRWALLAHWGKAKHWFVVHMVLGILGPVLVLAHSMFYIGSVNAGVALFSMLVVAASGVIGRFIYLRIHLGFGGERLSLQALQQTLGFKADAVHSQLAFAPLAEARLRILEAHAGKPSDGWGEHLRRTLVLPWEIRRVRRFCRVDTDAALARVAGQRHWDAASLRERQQRARLLVADYTGAVLRVAQLAAYTKLFSLWHVLHVPFVFLMVLCAIAHVVAVHAY